MILGTDGLVGKLDAETVRQITLKSIAHHWTGLREIRIEFEIDALPEVVWEILVDLGSYRVMERRPER
jgi:hypothetical protein